MGFDDYKVVLYRQDDGAWVAEIPALGGCYALMDTREAALAEIQQVFALIAQEHQERGQERRLGTHRNLFAGGRTGEQPLRQAGLG